MNKVEYQTKVWQVAYFNDDADMEEIKNMINKGNFHDIFDENIGFVENNTLYDTEEYLYPEDEGAATLEIYKNGELIYDNNKE